MSDEWVMVTGANGYIGSHLCKLLQQTGRKVFAVDQCYLDVETNNHKWRDCSSNAGYSDPMLLNYLISSNIRTVYHVGASSLVGPSVQQPLPYYHNNVGEMATFLEHCVRSGTVERIVFSSSAACYGAQTDQNGVCRVGNEAPCNPYGHTKFVGEQMLRDVDHAHNIACANLRYFNVAGASADGDLGQEDDATHILPRIINAYKKNRTLEIFGSHYDTRDGTAERDYVHVEDVVLANVMAADFLTQTRNSCTFNVGSGVGTTVKEMINAVEQTLNIRVKQRYERKRTGDPARLIADLAPIKRTLGWEPRKSLQQMITDAYNWHTASGPSSAVITRRK